MQIVTLKVEVDNSQLTKLQADVNGLNGTTIRMNAGDATSSVQKYSETVQKAAKSTDSLLSITSKFSQWYFVAGAVSGVTRSMRDALDAMKEVDSQLVVVRKVTGATGEELKQIEEQAYKTATAFGVVANEYLESVAAFSRAGYGNQSQALAELATKTQIVGDTNAETANQFLLSVDAAYKYKGNVEALSAVLDGANEIDNKYATSIEKIAEGLGTVAPVAAQAHVGVDELTAAIGTITAVTQRSGSEAARAFRALVLNILGDTKTEIDEGVTWTTGEIAGLRDVIKIYAKDAYEAAQATGSLIDPMEAIGGLAQSMKDGLLTEQKLMEMVSDIGGKLRTSQLLALIENWDMYQSMVADFGNAVGSADREVENALNSWERKTARLSNTWTEFISHLVETEDVKGGIDLLTGAVKLLDSGLGQTTIKAGLIFAALYKLNGLMGGELLAGAQLFVQMITQMSTAETLAAGSAGVLSTAMNAIPGMALVTVIGLVVYGLYRWAEANNEVAKSSEELKNAYSNAATELSSLQTQLNENNRLLDEANSLGGNENYIRRLQTENSELERQIALKQKERQDAAMDVLDSAFESISNGPNEYTAAPISATRTVLDAVESGETPQWADTYSEKLKELVSQLNEYILAVDNAKSAGIDLNYEQQNLYDTATSLVDEYLSLYNVQGQAAETAEVVSASTEAMQELMEAMSDGIDDVQSSLSILSAAQDEYNEYGRLSIDTLQQLLTLDAEYLNALFDETGALNLNSDAVADLLTDKSKLLEALAAEAVANYAAEEAERLLAIQTGDTGDVASTASGQIQAAATAAFNSGVDAANAAAGWRDLAAAIQSVYGGSGLNQQNLQTLQNNVQAYANSVRSALASATYGVGSWSGTSYSGSGGGGGGSRSSSSGGGSSGRNNAEKAAIQAQKKETEAEKKRAQKQRDEELAAINKQIEELKAQHKAQEKANKLTELQLDVEQAQLDLLNAQSERTVRYYNASTGQWEWIAKNTDVLKAEQALEDARKKLADEKAQQAYEEQLAVLEEQKKGLQDYWKNAINRFDDAIDTLQVKLSNLVSGSSSGGGGSSSGGSGSGGTSYGDYKTGEAVKALQQFLNQSFGGRLTVDGIYGSATKNAVRNMQSEIGVQADGYYSSGTRNALYNYFVANHRPVANIPAAVYDSGGILHGLGGIKATNEDEMVLPPKQTKAVLKPAEDSLYQKAIDRIDGIFSDHGRSGEIELTQFWKQVFAKQPQNLIFGQQLSGHGYMYSEKNNVPTSVAGNTENRIGSQHNGNVAYYQFGGVQISEQDAKQMSVYEFARRSRNLGLHSWDK